MPQTSPGVEAQKEERENQEAKYSPPPEWKEMVDYHRQRLLLAKQARNTIDRKMDNLTFIQDYYSNEDAVNSYLRPKRNDDEVRVVGGTTEKRIESIVNELHSMNYRHEIAAFDREDRELQGLGRAMEDAVTRSNQLEDDEDALVDALWELVTQRAVFIEEILEEKRVGSSVLRMCRKRVRSSIEVILGDLTMPAYLLQEQPFIATYDRISLRTAKMFFGHYDNFKYVRGGQDLSVDVYGSDITFRLGILQQDECEVVRYMSVPDNEQQWYVNGVPMLKPGTPLPFQYPFPRYPLSCAVPKRMGHHTFYGRSMASALKYLQALNDETVRNIIRKFRQAIEPPRAVRAQERIYTRDMYNPGAFSYGVDADSMKPLVDHNGVTDAETTVMNMVKSMQDEFASRSDISLGSAPGKKQSATAVVEQQKQAIKMLGQIVLAWTSLIRQTTRNRVYNIIESFAEPDSKGLDPATEELAEEFHRYTLRDQPMDSGKNGTSIVQFIGRDLTQAEHESIDSYENEQEEKGEPVRLTVVNIKKLREMTVLWHISVASKPKDNDDLHKLMFQDKLKQAMDISQTIQRPLNGERVVDEFEMTWRAKDWFKEEEQLPQMPGPSQEGGGAAGGAPGGPQPNEAIPAPGTPPRGAKMQPRSKLGPAMGNGIRASAGKAPSAPAVKPKEAVGVT